MTIAIFKSTGMVENRILGRADLQVRFSGEICCPQPLIVGVCVCSQSGADCDNANGMMAIVMMVMMIVLVMVIIVPETLRQVGWLCQC